MLTITLVIYLDHNATTPVLRTVRDAMWPYLTEEWGNPSSAYHFGENARKAIDQARAHVALFVGCKPAEVIFTSCATEANNAAINSALAVNPRKRHIITSRTEHSSVLHYCEQLVRRGYEVTMLPVARDGSLDPILLDATIRPDTAIVSLMWANNETGTLSPVDEIGTICRHRGAVFHCDSVQALGKIPVDFSATSIDLMALSGHKLGAPKGIGALIVRDGIPYEPLIVGGKQENGRRGGTENVAYIVGLGVACKIANEQTPAKWRTISGLRDQLEGKLLAAIEGSYRNGASSRLPNTLNFGIKGIESQALVAFLDARGICVSSGSACMESALAPSHVILAMTNDHKQATESIRISLGLDSRADEAMHAADVLIEAAKALR